MRHPLPYFVKHWPPEAKEARDEKSAIIEADYGCSRSEADRLAEEAIRAMWSKGNLPLPDDRQSHGNAPPLSR